MFGEVGSGSTSLEVVKVVTLQTSLETQAFLEQGGRETQQSSALDM